mmetsp:Transcript_10396/g.21997  ORF Transcript_10396/g.21997 Transcript_10396/m.21997 type:complete len:90 (-) Transcript_10396:98-367(-)
MYNFQMRRDQYTRCLPRLLLLVLLGGIYISVSPRLQVLYGASNSLCAAPMPTNAAAKANKETELRVCVGDSIGVHALVLFNRSKGLRVD